MGRWVHRTTKQLLESVSPASLSEPQANYISEPDLSAVVGQPNRYWTITGDVISLMDQAARDAIDAADDATQLDAIADELTQIRTITRTFAEVVLDELNAHALKTNEILDAIDGASNLAQVKSAVASIANYPQRTLAQLRNAVRGKI